MDAKQFIHPEDAKALRVLKRMPFFETVVRAIMEDSGERLFYGEHLAMMVRVNAKNYPVLHKLFKKVVKACGISCPDLYVYNDPVPNAYTYGETSPIVAVSSGLLNLMEEDELKSVLAHECGHIVCHHTLYTTMVHILLNLADVSIGISHVLMAPIELGLMYWSRRSEYSADRCSVLVAGEEATQRAMLKLASGTREIVGNSLQLVEQGKEYVALTEESWIDKVQQNGRMAFYSHPQMCIRALEIHRWAKSNLFRRLSDKIEE